MIFISTFYNHKFLTIQRLKILLKSRKWMWDDVRRMLTTTDTQYGQKKTKAKTKPCEGLIQNSAMVLRIYTKFNK